MNLAECRDLPSPSVWCTNASSAVEPVRMSPGLCQQMLKVLGRDDNLRRTCVRRRWQGLVDKIEVASPRGPNDARTCR